MFLITLDALKVKKLKEFLLILNIIFYCLFFFPQEVVSSSGESFSNSNQTIDFTLGEFVTETFLSGLGELTQGFQQTNFNITAINNHNPIYEYAIFPNPTTEILNIKINKFEGIRYSLYNAQGKLIIRNKLYLEQTPVNLSQLPFGNYLLNLRFEAGQLKTHKIIKLH